MGSEGFSFPFSKTKLPKQLFINGKYVDSANKEKLTLYNPVNGDLLADDVPLANEQDVDEAVAAAEKAFPAWRKLGNRDRRNILERFANLVEQHTPQLAELTRLSGGHPYEAFGKGETGMVSELLRYYAGWIDKFAGESFPQEDGFLKIVRNEPLGVCAGITPWNGPLGVAAFKFCPALATGNCFILKPSEKTPLSSLALGALAKEAGVPDGVFQVLSGGGSTGALLAAHMRVRKISFTGSIPTGKKVEQLAAQSNLKRVTLELGGKSPLVVFDDANLEQAAGWAAKSIAANSGQICIAPSRVYVQEGVYEKFLQIYQAVLKGEGAGIGDPEAKETKMGPIVDKAQFDRVMGFLDRGQKGQGKLLMGGKQIGDKGFYIEPTIFTDVDAKAEIHTQEIFGPVAVVGSFKTEEEIIQRANDTHYGLNAAVFTQDINRAMRVAADFDSGLVGVNCTGLLSFITPFGGSKESGTGRELGSSALRAYTEPKTVVVNLSY